jgi:hypothetical protein
MASETQKKPRKEVARRENKQQKAARFAERKHERENTDNKLEQKKPNAEKPSFRLEPQGKPIYFSRAATPRYPNRKSEITLYNVKSS